MPNKNHPDQSSADPMEILAQAQIDIENHPNQEVHLVMRLPEGLALIGLLQLVCRHPKLPERQARVAQEVVKSLEKQIATTPALKRLIAMGWRCDAARRSTTHDRS